MKVYLKKNNFSEKRFVENSKANPITKVNNLSDLIVSRPGLTVGTEDSYNNFVWVYSSIVKKASLISALNFEFKKETLRGAPAKINRTDPVKVLFDNPNYDDSSSDFWEQIVTYLETYGMVYIILPRGNVSQLPEAMYVSNPKNWYVDVDRTTGVIKGYKYLNNSNYEYIGVRSGTTLQPYQVMCIKRMNPKDKTVGLEPSSILSGKLALDKYSEEYNMNFFRNGAKIDGFIESEDQLSEEQVTILRSQFNKIHSTYENAHKIGILEGGMKWRESKITQRDMEFIAMKKMTREEIFSVYGTNSIVLGLYEDVKSYEGIRAAHKIFWEDTLIPLCKYLAKQFYDDLLVDVAPQYTPYFDLSEVIVLQDDFNKKVETAERLWRMGFTRNEINRVLGLGFEDASWGDEWWGAGSITNIVEQWETKKTAQPKYNESTVVAENSSEQKPVQEENTDAKIKSTAIYSKLRRFIFEDRADTLRSYYSKKEKDFSKHNEKFIKIVEPELSVLITDKSLKDGLFKYLVSVSEKASKISQIDTKKENIDFLIKRHYNSIDVVKLLKSFMSGGINA